jgi:uncharacterized protein YqhQ
LANNYHYGGQAVIEGVMMLGRKGMSIAVRRSSGDISVSHMPLNGMHASRIRTIPFLRGIFILIETLFIGVQAISYSANVALETEGVQMNKGASIGLIAGALAFSFGLFFMLPLFLTNLVDPVISSPLVSNLVDGIIRMSVFILYLLIVNRLPDIRRIWAYHGAEHKTINAYENGAPLEVNDVKNYSTAHVRCGTAFLLITMVISFIVFALVGRPVLWIRILSRFVLIPVIAAISYEVTRFSANHTKNKFISVLFRPGLALQKITTREPDDKQLEVAISALKSAITTDTETDVISVNTPSISP